MPSIRELKAGLKALERMREPVVQRIEDEERLLEAIDTQIKATLDELRVAEESLSLQTHQVPTEDFLA